MWARARIWLGTTGLFLGVVCAEYGAWADGPVPPDDGPLAGEAHPQLTENEYRLVAEQSQTRAAGRTARRAARLSALQAQLSRAKTEGNTALEVRLSAVVGRLEAAAPKLSEEERWSRAHGRKMTMRSLWARFGTKLHDPAVVAEFDTHAWRVARLLRSRQVADTMADDPRRTSLRIEVEQLMVAETERHRSALGQLLGASSRAADGATSPAVATSPVVESTR